MTGLRYGSLLAALAALTLLAAGCGSSGDPAPVASTPTPAPSEEGDEHRFEPGHSDAVREYYRDTHVEDDGSFEGFDGESEADYHQPPRPATGGVGDAITLTGTNLGIRLRVRVTDVTREGLRLAVHLALTHTGGGVFDARLDDARVTYGAGHRAKVVLGVEAPCSNGFQDYIRIEPLEKRRGCLLFDVPPGDRAKTLQLSLEQVPVAAGGIWNLDE